MEKIVKKSYSKINLGLQVLNKRPDGFHNINTIFKTTGLADELSFIANNTDELNIVVKGNESLNNDEFIYNNIIVGVFNKLRKKTGKKIGVDLELTKNIPIGAGLGGGSSNAAIAIKTLMDMFKINLTQGELSVIAQSAGSDVPYFINVGFAVAKSRGEKLKYFTLPYDFDKKFKMILVNPNIHISTKEVYSKLNRKVFEDINRKQNLYPEINFYNILARANENPHLLKDYLVNDFEKVLFELYPEIKQVKQEFYKLGASFSLMAGSGSSVFALFNTDDKDCGNKFEQTIRFFKENYPQYFLYSDMLDEHE